MSILDRARVRWRALFHKRALDRELEEEFRFHLEMEQDRYRRVGMSPARARRLALARFGPAQRFKEETREARGVKRWEDFVHDIRYAFRLVLKNPGFAGIAILTLALGIGAITALFSIVDGVLLQPLPFERPEELVLVWAQNEGAGQDRYFTSPMEFDDWQQRNATFADMAAFWRNQVAVTETDGGPSRLQAALVSHNLFRLLGARPELGRLFTPEDGVPGAPTVSILGHGMWQRRFGGDPEIVGKMITVDGNASAVVGVLAREHAFPEDAEIWNNINFPYQIQSRYARWMNVIGRLAPGATVEVARDDMDKVARQLADEYPQTNEGWTTTLATLHDNVVGDVKPALLVLLAATGLILLVACANVANLLLSRSEARAREIALRTAFGASRGRLARQLLTESLVLAGLGAVAGIALAYGGLGLLRSFGPDTLPRLGEVRVDATVLAVSLVSTLLTGFLFGLAPVVRLLRANLQDHLKEGAKGSKGREGLRLQSTFVVGQLAIALVLVVGSALLVRSFANLRSVNPGFRTSGMLTFEMDLPGNSYPDDVDVSLFYERALEQLRTVPGADAVAMASSLPLRESRDYNQPFAIADRPPAEDVEYRAYHRQVDPEYFSTMGIPLLAGRGFNDLDVADGPGVAIISEAMARTYWPEEDPVGDRLVGTQSRYGPLGAILPEEAEIVGVVDDVKYSGLKLDSEPSIYFSYRQAPFRRMTVTMRTSGDPNALIPGVREALREVDPTLPISEIAAIDAVVRQALARDRFSTTLLSVFGVVALVLATVGIYGVLSFAVEQRLREMGIRLALGAQRSDVVRLILRDGLVLVVVGLGLGVIAALAMTRLLQSQLYGVSPTDISAYLAVALFLALVATAASYIPARRATRADPAMALRQE